MDFPIKDIVVDDRHRVGSDISDLVESIQTIGLLNPITVVMQKEGIGGLDSRDVPVLVAGLRRLRSCEALGWETIPVSVLELYDLDLELAEFDENLMRQDLTALERGEQLERRKWIYEQRYPDTRAGVAGGKATNENLSFVENTAKSIDKTKRSVQLDIAAVSGIPQSLRNELRNTKSATSQADLKALARKKDDITLQKDAVRAVVEGKATSLRAALKDDKAPTKSQSDAALDQLSRYMVELGADPERLKILFAPLKKKNPMCAKLLWRLRQRDAA